MSIQNKIARIEHYADQAVWKKLHDTLAWCYGLPYPRIQQALWRPLVAANRLRTLVWEDRVAHAFRMQGPAREGGLPLKVMCLGGWEIGRGNNVPLYRHLLFQDDTDRESVQVEDCGTFPAKQLRQRAETAAGEVDMVLVNTNSLALWDPPFGEWVRGPSDLRMILDFAQFSSWEEVKAVMHNQSNNLRVLRRSGFTYRISRDEADFDLFYYQMYVPMVKARYEDFGEIVNEEGIQKIFKKEGFLLMVENDKGEAVSGSLQAIRFKVVDALLNGVRDGRRDLVRQGALTALYYFTIHWCYDQGYRRFDAGVCLPFESDGVYKHKVYWGLKPVLNGWRPYELLLWAPHSAPAAIAWLQKNRFVPQFARWNGERVAAIYKS